MAGLRSAIADEVLAPGTQLPTRAELTQHTRLSPSTVGHALQLLERDGLVKGRQGRGCFVLDIESRTADVLQSLIDYLPNADHFPSRRIITHAPQATRLHTLLHTIEPLIRANRAFEIRILAPQGTPGEIRALADDHIPGLQLTVAVPTSPLPLPCFLRMPTRETFIDLTATGQFASPQTTVRFHPSEADHDPLTPRLRTHLAQHPVALTHKPVVSGSYRGGQPGTTPHTFLFTHQLMAHSVLNDRILDMIPPAEPNT